MAVHVVVRASGLLALAGIARWRGGSAHHALVSWDAGWYRGIALHGYGFSHAAADGRMLSDYAFFPLYPALERWVASVTGLQVVDAGLVISAVSSVAAAWGMYLVAERVCDARTAVVLVALWSALPISIVQSMAYAESLFTALAAWAIYSALDRRFVAAGALAVLAGLTRPMGAAVAVAVIASGVSYLASARRPRDVAAPLTARASRAVWGMVLAPLGILSYVGFVGVRSDSPWSYLQVANGWGNGLDGGVAFASWIGRMLWSSDALAGLLLLGGLALLVFTVLQLCDRSYPAPVLAFTLVAVVLTLLTSGYFGSKPRYLLPVFPLLMPLAASMANRPRRAVLIGLTVLVAVSDLYGALWLFGPGPP